MSFIPRSEYVATIDGVSSVESSTTIISLGSYSMARQASNVLEISLDSFRDGITIENNVCVEDLISKIPEFLCG